MFKDIVKIYEYREMLKSSVRKELRSRYKGSFLGFFWTFLNPLLTLIIFSIVFSTVMRITIPNYSYALFLFVGLVPWMLLTGAVQQSTTAIIANGNLIKKIYFPRLILPLSVTITNLVNMLLTFIIVLVALLITRTPVTWLYLFLPLIILAQTLFVLSLSIILSSVTVYFRDLEHIISVLTTAWFYLTPVIYPVEYIPKEFLWGFNLNPMMPVINAYRDVLMFGRIPDMMGLLYVFVFSSILLTAGYFIFNCLQKRFAEEI